MLKWSMRCKCNDWPLKVLLHLVLLSRFSLNPSLNIHYQLRTGSSVLFLNVPHCTVISALHHNILLSATLLFLIVTASQYQRQNGHEIRKFFRAYISSCSWNSRVHTGPTLGHVSIVCHKEQLEIHVGIFRNLFKERTCWTLWPPESSRCGGYSALIVSHLRSDSMSGSGEARRGDPSRIMDSDPDIVILASGQRCQSMNFKWSLSWIKLLIFQM